MLHHAAPRLCILASGSAGNCSALLVPGRGLILIDLGLSPRRTMRTLAAIGAEPLPILAVLLTHLDVDHFHPSWLSKLPRTVPLHIHRKHLGRAARDACLFTPTYPFDEPFSPAHGLTVKPLLTHHDELGVASFRFEFATGHSLGFATDVGRPTPELINHLSAVDVLAIESNYCPRMQEESPRPEFLKHRITGGRGHLSNQQSAHAVRLIRPSRHVVLLHLSQQCNTPDLARAEHQAHHCPFTISSQHEPTPWIDLSETVAGGVPPPTVLTPCGQFSRQA